MWLIAVALAWSGDVDGDAIDDAVDNCLYVNNADQADGNGDGYGDACAHPTATLGSNVVLSRDVTVSAGAVIGDDVILLRRAYIGVDAIVGDGAIVRGRLEDAAAQGPVRVADQAVVAWRSVLESGAVVGARAAVRGTLRAGASTAEDSVITGTLGPLVQVGQRSVVGARVGSQSIIGADVRIGRAKLGHRVTVHDGARIGRSAEIGDDSVVGVGTVVGPRSELGDRTQLGDGARVRNGAELGDDVSVGEDAVLRRDSEVGAGTAIVAGTVSGPGVVTMSGSEVCADGVDNDADSLVDCLDTDCASHFACSVETACADGQDNDYDGNIDCADRDCTGQASCPGESDCTDGIDNNNSGAADCADPSCFGAPGCTVELLCDDGLDNDGDGYADIIGPSWYIQTESDTDCVTFVERCNTSGLHVDNDGDGFIAELDADCLYGAQTEVCNNGVDDDENGLADCEDPACATADMCVENCLDGLDNDLDGDVDCQDSDCLDVVCLAERRIPGGRVFAEDSMDNSVRFHRVAGGGCQEQVARHDIRRDIGSMDITLDAVQVRLRVPTSQGAFSSSSCLVDQYPVGRAYAPHALYGQLAVDTPHLTKLLVLQDGITGNGGRVSDDCNWPGEARQAAMFYAENGAHLERDVGDQALVLSGAGPWDLGEPSYWTTEVLSGSTAMSSTRVDNCWGLSEWEEVTRQAEWDLPAQTHTFLPPE